MEYYFDSGLSQIPKRGGEEELVYAQMLLSALSPTQKYTKCGISNYSKCLL